MSQGEGTWEDPRREPIAQVVGGQEAEWGEAYREREGQENSRRPATDYAKENPCLPSSLQKEPFDSSRRPP